MSAKAVLLICISLLGSNLGAQEPLRQEAGGSVIEPGSRIATLLSSLQSDSIPARTAAARSIHDYGGGTESENLYLYGVMASTLDEALRDIDGESPRLDEVAWMAKALGTSGDSQYLPLLDRVIATGIGKLERHGDVARGMLMTSAQDHGLPLTREEFETACTDLNCAAYLTMPDLKLCALTTRRAKLVQPLRTVQRHILTSRHGAEVTATIMSGVPFIGMPEWALVCSWGPPTRVNVLAGVSGGTKEYVYAPVVAGWYRGLTRWATGDIAAADANLQRASDDVTRFVTVVDGKVASFQIPTAP